MHIRDMVTKGNLEDSYIVGGVIGKGAFSTVRVAKDRKTLKKVAIKYVSKGQHAEEDLAVEVTVLRVLGRHANISKFYGLHENDKYYMLVMEYLKGGELIDVMIRRVEEMKASYTEAELAIIILQIVRAVEHCHKHRVVHRDIKPDNILCTDYKSVSDAARVIDGPVKLADFGLSAIIPPGVEGLKLSSGTPNYMAPERLCGEMYDFKSDIWSIGVVLYILIEGHFPFPGDDEEEITRNVLDPHMPKYDSQSFSRISDSCKSFLNLTFTKDPHRRPTASELLRHEWLQGDTASTSTIKGAVEGLKRFNVRLKFKAMIRAILARNRLHHILKALRCEQMIIRLVEYGLTVDDLKQLSHCFRVANWGHVMLDKEAFIETLMTETALPDNDLARQLYQSFHDANGFVNTRDLLLALALRLGSSGDERLATVFWLFDKTDSGAIDFPAYYDMVIAIVGDGMSEVHQDALEQEFREADLDGNGVLEKDEFIQLAARNEVVRGYFDRLRRLMAGRREVFLSELDEVRAKKRGWLFMRYGGLFQRWVERYLVVTDDLRLEIYEKDPGDSKRTKVKPTFFYTLRKSTISIVDRGAASSIGGSSTSISGSTPFGGARVRKASPPRCRFECPEGSFLLEGKTIEEMNAWLGMFGSVGIHITSQTHSGNPSSPRRPRSMADIEQVAAPIVASSASPRSTRHNRKSIVMGTDFLFGDSSNVHTSACGDLHSRSVAPTNSMLSHGPLRSSMSLITPRRGSGGSSVLAESIVSDTNSDYEGLSQQPRRISVQRSGSMRFAKNKL